MKIPESVYERLAKKYGITTEEVKREMQKAINDAFVNANPAALAVPRKNIVPTVDEFFSYALNRLDKQ